MYSFNLFTEGELSSYLKYQLEREKEAIKSSDLSTISDLDYIKGIVSRLTMTPPQLKFDDVFASDYEKEIPADRHPNAFFIDSGRSFPRQVIVYHIPFVGSLDLLKYKPNPAILWSQEVSQERRGEGTNICLEVINFGDDAERVKREFDEFKQKITTQLGHITNQVKAFNESLDQHISECVEARKKELGKQKGVLDQLGVPVKK